MLAISISAVLLCIVGVWAATTMNLSFKGSISPDIYCKITSGDNGDIPIFNNYNQAEGGKPSTNGNTLSTSVTLTAGVTNEIKFWLTSYTENKYIRLSVADISGATIKSGDVAVCPPASQSTTPQTMTIFVAGDSQATTATISLKVEEVYKVTVESTELATGGGDHYFAPGDNCEITLEPMVGYQLPTTIIIPTVTVPDEEANEENATKEVSIATYSRDSNTCGTVSLLNKYLKNCSISANCNQIFAIKKSTAQSLGTAGDTVEINNQTTYLPNNGQYTYTDETKTAVNLKNTAESKFIEYPYYVEMGLYPQTKVSALAGTPNDPTPGQTFTVDDITYEYVVNTDAEKTGWYKYEPIKWIVLETQDSTYSLSELKFQNGMLYTDGACGKPYTGQLVLMSAYVLESSAYNYSQSSTQSFSTSSVASWLQDPFGLSSTGENGITLKNAASIDDGQYLKKQSLDSQAVTSTYINSAMSNTFNKDNMETAFFLLGGKGKATLTDATSVDEEYYAGTYFNVGGIYEGKGQSTFNVGVTSPTAYAIATGVEISSFSGITQSFSATATRGWGGFGDSTALSTCAYWTRSGGESFGAYVISMQAQSVNILATNDNVGVRPMVVLDMGFYETGIYTETNNAQSQSET
ncbi:MAG: hypothetical protein ACLRFR_00180 [Clostridia bacterium]